MYLIIAILMFSFLIFIHEFGHFFTAKLFGVKVNEFSIFMGPRLLHWGRGETTYSLRLLPIGGFCAMEGEDGSSDDPRAFTQKAPWKRAIILAAGAGMNFLTGFLVLVLLYVSAAGFRTLEVTEIAEGCKAAGENGIQVGDVITEIDGENLYIFSDFQLITDRVGQGLMDVEVLRDGKKVTLRDVDMSKSLFEDNGQQVERYGLTFGAVAENSFGTCLRNAWLTSIDFARMVKMGLLDLITGAVGMKDMSGPVGIVDAIQETGHSAESTSAGVMNVIYFGAFIAINLAFMNMLPIPALDGGHIFFLIVTWIVEGITKKKIDPKYEAYIHAAGLVLLLGLMLLVTLNDIVRILAGG
ncbi:MAG: site-2 protease family protein [Oscillospiraceae bacterium]|nr:site-2 protease family protein [Oscillospiraceae bacterium]